MKEFDVWDVEDLEELLEDKDLTRDQEENLRSCLNLLQNKATRRDRARIRRYQRDVDEKTAQERRRQLE